MITNRVGRRISSVFLSVAVAILGLESVLFPIEQAGAVPQGFVYADGPHLMLDGKPWRAVGVNQWDLEGFKVLKNDWAGCYYQRTDLDLYFNASFATIAEKTRATVVRTFGFMAFYTGAGADWGSTDKLLYYARKYNVRVIPVFGFTPQRCGEPDKHPNQPPPLTWYRCTPTPCTPGFKDPEKNAFGKSYYDYVLDAVRRYKDDPTIAYWQLMNEARNYISATNGSDMTALTDFAREMVNGIRNVAGDPNHLINLGTIGKNVVPRPSYGCLLDGDNRSPDCPDPTAGFTAGFTDLLEGHDYEFSAVGSDPDPRPPDDYTAIPLGGLPLPSLVKASLSFKGPPGTESRCKLGGETPLATDRWIAIKSGITQECTGWSVDLLGPANTTWTAHVDHVVINRGTANQAFWFETGTDGFTAADPTVATVTQSTRHANTGTGSLRIDVLKTGESATTRRVTINAPPLPPKATVTTPFPTLEFRVWASFNAPIQATGIDSIAADLHDAVIARNKPFFLGEAGITAEVPSANPAFQAPDYKKQLMGPSCPETGRSLADRAAAFDQMMGLQFDDEHLSSGMIVWDWKDPELLSTTVQDTPTGKVGVLQPDPMTSCWSITPGDPAAAVIAKWALQTSNPPLPPCPSPPAPRPVSCDLRTYDAAMYFPHVGPLSPNPSIMKSNGLYTISLRMLKNGGNPYPGVKMQATGGCVGTGTADPLGYVAFSCRAPVVAGETYLVLSVAPDLLSGTCLEPGCDTIGESYTVKVIP